MKHYAVPICSLADDHNAYMDITDHGQNEKKGDNESNMKGGSLLEMIRHMSRTNKWDNVQKDEVTLENHLKQLF